MHTVMQKIEKVHQYKMVIVLLLLDFNLAFDTIKRKELIKLEIRVHIELRKLIHMTIKKAVTVKTQNGNTEEFEVSQCVRWVNQRCLTKG